MTAFIASLTNLTNLLPQSHDCRYYVSSEYWYLHRSEYINTLIYAHTTSCTLPACDISLGCRLTLPAPGSGDFMELIVLYA